MLSGHRGIISRIGMGEQSVALVATTDFGVARHEPRMRASTIVILVGLALTIFGLPIPGLSVLGILVVLLGVAARVFGV